MLSAMKRLFRHPRYFLTLVLVMATGLGGALSLYGISDAVLFRPLQVENADTLVRIFRSDKTLTNRSNWARPIIQDYLDGNEAFADVAYYVDWARLSYSPTGQDTITFTGALVSGNFFDVVGTNPLYGRLLQVVDDVEGASVVGVLSYEIWHSRFNGRKDIIGEAITLNGQPVTIVGIAQPNFSGVSLVRAPDIWLPVSSAVHMAMPSMPTQQFLHSPTMYWLNAVARLAPGITLEQARASLEAARLAHADEASSWPPAKVFLARDVAVDPYGSPKIEVVAWVLFGLVGVLLIVVCADAAGLMLIRAEAARAETGVRLSLGATRRRIANDVLREAGIIVVAAGVLAGLFALILSGWLQQIIGADLALPEEPGALIFNTRVLAAFGAMALLATALSCVAPIQRLGRMSLVEVLRGARHGDARRALNVRDSLVMVQIGLSVLLLTVSIMFIGALQETLAIDPGFKINNRAVAFVSPSPTANKERAESYQPILRALRNDPRVQHAAVASLVPVSASGVSYEMTPQGYTPAADEDMHVDTNRVSSGYFETLGIRLLRGRDFAPGDIKNEGIKPVLVNKAFIERYWPGQNGVGMQIAIGEDIAEVIGVVADNKQQNLRELPRPIVYITFEGAWVTAYGVIVAAKNPEIAMSVIRDTARAAGGTVRGLESMRARINDLTQRDRAITWLAVGAAIFATLLAVVGMYGVAVYAARQRQREIGIRYALGATKPQVARQFIRRGLIVAVCGIGTGLLLTVLVSHYFAGIVAGVKESNVAAMLFAGLLFATVALLANLVPVWRATNVAPMTVLRDE